MAIAKLGGFTLLGSSPITWSLTAGVRPYTTTVDMIPADADAIISGAAPGRPVAGSASQGPVSLELDTGGSAGTISGVYVLGRAASASPHVAKVTLADRRCWWPYWHIGPRRYNWRRRAGFKRLKDLATPDVVEDVQGDVWYAPWSLKTATPGAGDPKVWEAREILENVFETVVEMERDFNGLAPRVIFDEEPDQELPVENLLLDSDASQAISRALANMPEMDIYLDQNGNIHVYSKASGKERDVYAAAGAEKVGGGHVEVVANALVRPSKIHVLFTREVEVRFDYEELTNIPALATQVGGETETRGMKNVLPNPDFLSDSGKPSGSWMTFDEALNGWNATTAVGSGVAGVPGMGKLDYPKIRKALVPFMDLWAGILLLGATQPDVDWAARINALQQHYRKTFQINQLWWQRILSVHSYRVAIIDKETGSRAPAAVWANFSRLGTMRSFFKDLGGRRDLAYAMNVKSYPDKVGAGPDFADAYPVKKFPQAASRVTISDPDQGVLHIDFVTDPNAMYEMCFPSMVGVPPFDDNGVPKDAGPTANAKDRNRPFTYDAMSSALKASNFANVPQLAPNHRVAIILTAIPAAWFSPKGAQPIDNQLHDITIEANDTQMAALLPDHVRASLGDAKGPEQYVRIGAGVEVARVAWIDERHADIERIFGVGDGNPPNLNGMVINEGSGKKGASLNQIALSVAASIYAAHADHLQGNMTGTYNPNLTPAGWVDEISHEIGTSGEGSTKIDFPEKLPKLDMLAFMDPSTRATIMKLAQPGVGGAGT